MFFNKKKQNPLLELREQFLTHKYHFEQAVGNNGIVAIITDYGSPKGGYSLIVVSDGGCSLYFEKGGGIIGAGQHKNVQIVCEILLNKADEIINTPVSDGRIDFPKGKEFVVHIITQQGVDEISGNAEHLSEQDSSGILFYLCDNILTQIRLLDERKNEPFSNDEILVNFVKENNYNAFTTALNEFNNPNAVIDNKSVLTFAVYNADKETVKKLIEKGADITFEDDTGLNPLMIASYLGKSEIIEDLISNETVNSSDNEGQTPLMYACNAGKFDCVKKLVEQRADINARDNQGSTPIMFAAQHGYDDIAVFLLENGADTGIVGKHGLKAIDLAIQNKHQTTIEILKK